MTVAGALTTGLFRGGFDEQALAGGDYALVPAFGVPSHREIGIAAPDRHLAAWSLEAQFVGFRSLVEGIVSDADEQGFALASILRCHFAYNQGTTGGQVSEDLILVHRRALLTSSVQHSRTLKPDERS